MKPETERVLMALWERARALNPKYEMAPGATARQVEDAINDVFDAVQEKADA